MCEILVQEIVDPGSDALQSPQWHVPYNYRDSRDQLIPRLTCAPNLRQCRTQRRPSGEDRVEYGSLLAGILAKDL